MASFSIVGAHLLCFINGQILGEARDVEWSGDTPRIARRGIDSSFASEISTTTVECSGQLAVYRLHASGGLEGKGIVAPQIRIHRENAFSLLLIDRATGLAIAQADHCFVQKQQWHAGAKSQLLGTFSFIGIEMQSEARY